MLFKVVVCMSFLDYNLKGIVLIILLNGLEDVLDGKLGICIIK